MSNVYFFRPVISGPIKQTLLLDIRNSLRGHSFETYTLISNKIMPLAENPLFSMVSADVFIVFAEADDLENDLFFDHVIEIVNYSTNVQKLFIPIFFGDFLPPANYSPLVRDLFQSPNAVKIPKYNREEIGGYLELINFNINNDIANRRIEAKAQEIKQNIEDEAPEFIKEAKQRLIKRAQDFKETSTLYFTGGFFVLVAGIIISLIIYVNDSSTLGDNPNTLKLVFFFIKSLVVLSLGVAISRYCFNLGKAYMHEALKIEDRIHAISFGEFYLNVYKEGLKPEDIKEVFRDWNINNTSTAFMSEKSDDWDPKVLEKMLDVLSKAKDVVKK